MFEVSPDHAEIAAALLTHYSFDLGDYSSEERVQEWGMRYEYYWVYLAVIEALYQGRYKSISVDQILSIWLRRGKPIYHFSLEFEQLISRNLRLSSTRIEAEDVTTPLVEVEVVQSEESKSPFSGKSLGPLPAQRKSRFLTKPPRTSTSIHTDFMVKLMQILENSQKTLPPSSFAPKNKPEI